MPNLRLPPARMNGHQLGMLDEYVDPASVNREKEDSPGVFDKDHSLMNNPDDEGRADVIEAWEYTGGRYHEMQREPP